MIIITKKYNKVIFNLELIFYAVSLWNIYTKYYFFYHY
jgi:hypothetical protein